jgi:hypothetical protein
MSRKVNVRLLLANLGIDATHEGYEWRATCPSKLHEDKHPSWRIKDDPNHPRHGWHHCFTCKFGGGPADLVMKTIGNSLSGAMRWLQENAYGNQIALSVSIRILPIARARFRLPPEVYQGVPLARWPSPARIYLERRGVTEEQVIKWDVGYAVDGRLSGRIIIPIHDASGYPRSYSARTFIDVPKRYMMPNEDPKKGPVEGSDTSAIWGEIAWPESRQEIIVSEGTFKALAVERLFPEIPLGALQGSHLSLGQLAKLSTFPEVFILEDPNYAGQNFARMIGDSLKRHSRVYRVRFRPGTDADNIPAEELQWRVEQRRSEPL